MLSLIYQLSSEFEKRHGLRPNLIYLNPRHQQQFCNDYPDANVRVRIMQHLGMEVVIDRDVIHPHVAWSSTALRRAG